LSLQVVLEAKRLENYASAVKTNVGAAVIIKGTVVLTPEAKQPLELHADVFTLEGASSPDYPLQKKKHSLEYLRTIAHLRARTNTFNAVFRIRSEAAFAIHKFFHDRGFVYVHTPIITASDCEGAGEMFRVTTIDLDNPERLQDGKIDFSKDFFGRETSLTVSGQLEGETMAMAFGKIYTFGPTFRAENSNTPRHAAEFWMIEPEIAFADLNDNMALADDMLKSVVAHLLAECRAELDFCNRFYDNGLIERLEKLVNTKSAHITYTEAIKILSPRSESFEYKPYWGCDLQTEHERYLAEEYFKGPVFITDYPKEIKAFYMRLNDDGKTVAAMDMLVPGIGEIIGGSQREERLELLTGRMRELGLAEEDYWWYLDLRRYGGTKHAGYGLGFERFIMYVTGISNIRDAIPYPRTVGNAEF
jgi:asparaginyl-tRNA synthetase